jgi:hypothetical protein
MARKTRDITLVYGSATIGGSSDTYEPTGCYRLEKSNARGRLEVDVLVLPSSAATFATFEEYFRNPRQACTFTYMSSTLISWNHSAGTGGVNTEAHCAIRGNQQTDNGLARLYTITIEADLIPDGTDQSGIRDHHSEVGWELDKTQSISLSGVYIGSTYTTHVDAYAAEVKSRHSISDWVLLRENKEEGRDGKLVTWSREYRERLNSSHDHEDRYDLEIDKYSYFSISGVYTGSNYSTDVNAYCATVKSRHSISNWVLIRETKDSGKAGAQISWTREYAETASTGLRDAKDRVDIDDARIKSVSLSGVYTGSSYQTDIDAYCATIQSRHSITTWELLKETKDEGKDAAQITWSREYREIRFDESAAGLSHAALINVRLNIGSDVSDEDNYDIPGQTPSAKPMDVLVQFSAAVDVTLITDIQDFYQGTVRDALVQLGKNVFSGALGSVALVGESASWDPYASRLEATLKLRAPNGSPIFFAAYAKEAVIRTGVTITPVFSGSAYAAVAYQGPATYIVTQTWTRLRLTSSPSVGSSGTGGGFGSGGTLNAGSFGQTWSTVGNLGGFQAGSLGSGIGGGVGSFFGSSGATPSGPIASGVSPSSPSLARPQKGAVIERRRSETPKRVGISGHSYSVIEEQAVEITQFWDDPASNQTTDIGRNATYPTLGQEIGSEEWPS